MTINIIEELMPTRELTLVGRPAIYNNEEYIRAMFKRLRTGVQWCELKSDPHFLCAP